jgi:hypothetical protein
MFGSAPTNWQIAEFRPDNGGEVFCDKGVTDHGREFGAARFRPIVVWRRKVMQIWPAPPPSVVPIHSSTAPGDRDTGGRRTSYPAVAAALERLLADDATLINQIDAGGKFKRIAEAVRRTAGKNDKDDGWANNTLRTHFKQWRESKNNAG